MALGRLIGRLLNFIFLGLVIGAFMGEVSWSLVGWSVPAFVILSFLVGFIGGRLG